MTNPEDIEEKVNVLGAEKVPKVQKKENVQDEEPVNPEETQP